MPHFLEFGAEPQDRWPINSYLLIHPFSFDRNNGNVTSQPDHARALFGAVTVQRPVGQMGPCQAAMMPGGGAFRVVNGDQQIASLEAFDVHAISTPCSLDMSRALIVMHASQGRNTRITATPMQCNYADFDKQAAGIQYWGAELKINGTIYLRASLSVPTYEWGTRCLAEYFALGPANSVGANGSIFRWLVHEGELAMGQNAGARLPALTIRDVLHGGENELFGMDGPGVQQMAGAQGVVFMMNGLFVDWSWRALARFIRGIVENPRDAVDLINSLPETKVDQSVRHTHQRIQPELRGRDTVAVGTADFEGIMVWGLGPRDGRVAPVHG